MATTTAHEQPSIPKTFINPKPIRVCFSFAAYAKNLIDQLQNSNIHISEGLTDSEFSEIESTFHFTFPPDLRSILREGLPVDHGFPNWRSSSTQQLQILTDLPILNLCRKVSKGNFWCDSWGNRPEDNDEAVNLAKGYLRKAPILVPIYRHCYLPSMPCLAGNPVFYVNGDEIKLWSFDISGFFQQVEFRGNGEALKRPTLSNLFNAPAWAATEARRIEFWTELVEREERVVAAARKGTGGWWSGDLGGCLEEVCGRLRDGGWKEDDVREMMMMDGGDENRSSKSSSSPDDEGTTTSECLKDRKGVVQHVRLLSETLLRAGWSTEDVVELLDLPDENGDGNSNWLDFQYKTQLNSNIRFIEV